MRDYLADTLKNEGGALTTKLGVFDKVFTEFSLGNYGRADIITANSECDCSLISVFELKNRPLVIDDLLQLSRYIVGVKDLLEIPDEVIFDQGYLIGTSFDVNTDFSYLGSLLNDISIFTIEVTADGIVIEKHSGYRLIHKGVDKVDKRINDIKCSTGDKDGTL